MTALFTTQHWYALKNVTDVNKLKPGAQEPASTATFGTSLQALDGLCLMTDPVSVGLGQTQAAADRFFNYDNSL